MHEQLSRIRLFLLLVAVTLAVVGFFPTASTADVTALGVCGDMGCPGGPNFCDYLPDGRSCNCAVDNCQPDTELEL